MIRIMRLLLTGEGDCQAVTEENTAHLLEFLNVNVQLTPKLGFGLSKR